MTRGNRSNILVVLQSLTVQILLAILLIYYALERNRILLNGPSIGRGYRYTMSSRIPYQIQHLCEIISATDVGCIHNLRLDRNAFGRLCTLLYSVGGLTATHRVTVAEQVAMFLSVIAHHKKNRIVKHNFKRSTRTVSKYFNNVLMSILRLYPLLVATPEPVAPTSTDERWKWFKGCLGALDGTYINVRVPESLKARYRSRKGHICVNVLGVCDFNMNFVYVLTGWEGSAADGRVLRDAVSRPNGLRVPIGSYYLCDAGYTNGDGFLAPYRGVRYHLKDWGIGNQRPQNARALFNLRHSKARNVIERAFGLLKSRWAILRSNSFYPISTQNRIIMACCLLHNFIRREMPHDTLDMNDDETMGDVTDDGGGYIETVEPSTRWSQFRDGMATAMYTDWTHAST